MSSALERSAIVQFLAALRDRLAAGIARSRVRRLCSGLSSTTSTAIRHSRLRAFARTIGRIWKGSWLYGWLTADPEPETVVIDLSETVTVGPVIQAVDRAGSAANWRQSWVGRNCTLDSVMQAPVWQGYLAVLCWAVALSLVELTTPPSALEVTTITLWLLVTVVLVARSHRSLSELRDTRIGTVVAKHCSPPAIDDEADE
jgi:hypothetical protein